MTVTAFPLRRTRAQDGVRLASDGPTRFFTFGKSTNPSWPQVAADTDSGGSTAGW